MDIEKEIRDLLRDDRIEKKLDDIKSLLIKKDLEQFSSSSSTGFWLFALLTMMSGGFGTSTPTMPTSITNIYTDKQDEVKE